MNKLIISALISFILSVVLLKMGIPLLRKIKLGQPIYEYVECHKSKNGTPTMGGLFFIVGFVFVYFSFFGFKNRLANMCAVITLSFMGVGFLDDFLKIYFSKNQGLKAYQKIVFQLSIAVIAGLFCYKNGLTTFNIPFSDKSVDLGWFTIPVVCFILIAITNSVNLTDGLDGLASSVSVVYLIFLSLICFFQFYSRGRNLDENTFNVIAQNCSLIGALLGFLCFNFNKASVFMGDTGSLSLGGFIGCVSIFTGNSLFILVLGFFFVLSALSVIVQVLYYKKTKKRVFLMAPLHHHFQLKGYTEGKICYLYCLITGILGAALIIFYL